MKVNEEVIGFLFPPPLSIQGRRENNEDSCVAEELGDGVCFFAVADGMGGVGGGEVASKMALDFARSFLEKHLARLTRSGWSEEEPDLMRTLLFETFRGIQQEIRNTKESGAGPAGMGTTLTCVLTAGTKFVVGNLGDSRVYKIANDALTQLTNDHTYIADFEKSSGKKADQAMVKQYGHMLLKSVDGGSDLPDILPPNGFGVVTPGDGFLLCSDGLLVDKGVNIEDDLRRYVYGTKNLEEAAKLLVDDAFRNGSKDNITVVVTTYGEIKRTPSLLPTRSRKSSEKPVTRTRQEKTARGPGQVRLQKSLITLAAFLCVSLVLVASLQYELIPNPFGKKTADSSQVQLGRLPWDPFKGQQEDGVGALVYRWGDEFPWEPYPQPESLKCYVVKFDNLKDTVSDSKIEFKEKHVNKQTKWMGMFEVDAVLINDSTVRGNRKELKINKR